MENNKKLNKSLPLVLEKLFLPISSSKANQPLTSYRLCGIFLFFDIFNDYRDRL